MATIPAYNPLNGVDNKSVGLDWRQERNSFFQRYFEPLRQTFRKQDTVKDILDNFIIRNYAGCDNKKVVEPLMKMKSTRRLTHLNVAQKKMFERRQDRMRKSKEQIVAEKSNSGKYSLLQVTKDGKERTRQRASKYLEGEWVQAMLVFMGACPMALYLLLSWVRQLVRRCGSDRCICKPADMDEGKPLSVGRHARNKCF